MVKMPCFETSCLETGVKTLVTETGQQLPPSKLSLIFSQAPTKTAHEIYKIFIIIKKSEVPTFIMISTNYYFS